MGSYLNPGNEKFMQCATRSIHPESRDIERVRNIGILLLVGISYDKKRRSIAAGSNHTLFRL